MKSWFNAQTPNCRVQTLTALKPVKHIEDGDEDNDDDDAHEDDEDDEDENGDDEDDEGDEDDDAHEDEEGLICFKHIN